MAVSIFFSHSTKDRSWCALLAMEATKVGVNPYLAEHDPRPGTDLAEKVRSNINKSQGVVIKKRARAAGLDPREFSGHSLRSGYATQAARDGHHPTQIAATTRHQDQRVLAGYIQAGRGKADTATVL